jgi:kynureninase
MGSEYELEIIPSSDGIHGPVEALSAALDEQTALLTLSHTVFKSGYTYPMETLTSMAHKAGVLTLWDLSHSAGAVRVQLNAADADFAVGCTYKYLNGGPGAQAYLYMKKALQDKAENPISGWIGQSDPFDFGLTYQPAKGMRRMLSGTPTILSIAAIEPGVDILLEAGVDALREKSLAQSDYLIMLWEEKLKSRGFALNLPGRRGERGSHIAITHEEGWAIDQALINEMNVIPDFRAPNIIRFGITPLYTSYEEIYLAVERLVEIMDNKLYEKYPQSNSEVT